MNVEELIDRLKSLSIRLEAQDGKLRVHAPKNAITRELDDAIRAHKQALLERVAKPAEAALLKAPRDQPIPASFIQEMIWFFEQMHDQTAVNNNPAAYPCVGIGLQVETLSAALTEVVRRHEILRTRFVGDGETLLQVIDPPHPVSIPVTDLQHLSPLPADERERLLRDTLRQACMRPFDLSHGPLLRVGLFKLGDDEYVFQIDAHHIIFDAWSSGVFLRELFDLYAAFASGQPSALKEPEYQYADLAYSQRQRLGPETLGRQEAYWRQKLAGLPPLLELPYDRPRPLRQSFSSGVHVFEIPKPLIQPLMEMGGRNGCSLFMTMLAVYSYLLARYSGRDRVPVASPISFRNQPELENIIGPCFNTLVFCNDVTLGLDWSTYAGAIRDTVLEAFAHQDLPFGRVIAAVNPSRSLAHEAIAQVSFNLKLSETPTGDGGANGTSQETDYDTSMKGARGGDIYDLSLNMFKDAFGLHAYFTYSHALFDAGTIETMARRFVDLCQAIATSPSPRLDALPWVGVDEARVLMQQARGADLPDVPPVLTALAMRAARQPDALALIDGNSAYTYRELFERIGRIACWLRAQGVGPETTVAVHAARSAELMQIVLATLSAGAAFLPIDPAFPNAHVSRILDAARPTLVVSDAADDGRHGSHRAITVDAVVTQAQTFASVEPFAVHGEAAAYVMYTSGSTGLPKGVVIPHRALANYCAAAAEAYGVRAGDRVMQFSSVSFDLFVEELFVTLTQGATLVLYPRERELSVPVFERFLLDQRIDVASIPTAYWHAWAAVTAPLQAVPALRTLIVGGEQPSPALLERWRAAWPGVEWINSYGPTETTVITACWSDSAKVMEDRERLPIGRAIANGQTYVLDEALRPLPEGISGLLYLGGPNLARGYLDDPVATALRFVPDPHADKPGARLYRSGDLARWRRGQIEVLGRSDTQVKIRGYRVEPTEVAERLKRLSGVADAAVVAVADSEGRKRLAGFYVSDRRVDANAVAQELRQDVADFMCPETLTRIETMPYTANGKIDTNRLTALIDTNARRSSIVPMVSDTEKRLAAIWGRLLEADHLGRNSNFFEVGGHSLLAIRLVHAVRNEFSVELAVLEVFRAPILSDMAERIERARAACAVIMAETDSADEDLELFRI
ncbi:hypothetical protein C7S18_08115 [Ahniella affigens]|uniref:Carrier domain-containing protein n=1 Tax=Ahniella affigens TaxID=2021234 RepID=A0A2P1PQN6_9GAMM|nr:non-ribosomal peptide synthetase [Ahniella affigens]AVP97160.1 hypothetical protein C7S18_08115 [Ahniella affigens]